MLVVGLLAPKGGAGKSTATCHLTACALEDGLRVSLIDLDPQGSSYGWALARTKLRGPDTELIFHSTQMVALQEVLASDRAQHVDLAILDTPGKLGDEAGMAISLADYLLSPCRPTAFDAATLGSLQRMCKNFGKEPHVLLSQVMPHPQQASHNEGMRQDIVKMGLDVIDPMIAFRPDFFKCLDHGTTAMEFNRRGDGANEMRVLYRHVMTALGMEPPASAAAAERGA